MEGQSFLAEAGPFAAAGPSVAARWPGGRPGRDDDGVGEDQRSTVSDCL